MKKKIIRSLCPISVCNCSRNLLIGNLQENLNIMTISIQDEKKLLFRLENLNTFEDLKHMKKLLKRNLGISFTITPNAREVRKVQDFDFIFKAQLGFCKKLKLKIKRSIQKSFNRNPKIMWRILDSQDLFST